MEIDPDAGENVSGQLWMVHGGGFYLVEKQTKTRDYAQDAPLVQVGICPDLDQRYVSPHPRLLYGRTYA